MRRLPKRHWFNRLNSTPEQHRFYVIFEWIRGRCNRKSQPCYRNYWWRWIKCTRECFDDFRKDMWESFKEHMDKYGARDTSIDRIDVNGDYSKENCRRATWKEQCSSRRNTLYVEIDGVEYTSRKLTDIIWICHQAANNRLKKYAEGKMTKEEVFYVWRLPRGVKSTWDKIKWVVSKE